MKHSKLIIPSTKDGRDWFERALWEVGRENFVWIPADDLRYLGGLLASRANAKLPRDLGRHLRHLHNHIPRETLKRYDRLKEIGDAIVYFSEYWGIADVGQIGTTLGEYRAFAQNYYDDAARIGKRLLERDAPVLEHIANNLDEFGPVLREARLRRVA
jgi:hypothetical protein